MRKILLSLLLTLGLAVTAHAQDYDVDFINDDPNGADNTEGERGIADGTVLDFDGIFIQFSASSGTGDGYAYFDSNTAGLGVCGTLATLSGVPDQCHPGSDDNLTTGEILYMAFFENYDGQTASDPVEVMLSEVVFRGQTAEHVQPHAVIDNDYAELSFGFADNAMSDVLMDGFSTGYSSTFVFAYADQEYYLSTMTVSVIPEPSTWLMMLIGFCIVTSASRRSHKRKHHMC